MNAASPVQVLQTFILDDQGYLSPAPLNQQQVILRPVMMNTNEPERAQQEYDFDRRVVSNRDYIEGNLMRGDLEDINRSQDIITAANANQYVSIAQTPAQNRFNLTRQAQPYNTMSRRSNNRLDVISEDEGALQ